MPKQPKLKKLSVKERQEVQAKLSGKSATRATTPAPKPMAERSVDELYPVLLSAWNRYRFVLANPTKGHSKRRLAQLQRRRWLLC